MARAVLISALLGQAAMAALDVTVTVSPTGLVGRPSEVLVRTYAPVNAGDLALPQPSLAYPAPSGLWNVLYPVGDYPFDVVAHSPNGGATKVELGRDPSDASLWRGSVTPDVAGEWTITVSNFPGIEPTHFMVAAGDPSSHSVGRAHWAFGRCRLGHAAGTRHPTRIVATPASVIRRRWRALADAGDPSQASRSEERSSLTRRCGSGLAPRKDGQKLAGCATCTERSLGSTWRWARRSGTRRVGRVHRDAVAFRPPWKAGAPLGPWGHGPERSASGSPGFNARAEESLRWQSRR